MSRPFPRWAAPSTVVAAAIAAYVTVIVVPYAFEDDYWILGATHGLGGANVWKSTASGGRPIMGLLLTGVFSAVPRIDTLRVVRLLALVGVVLLGLLLYYALRRHAVNRWVAAAAAVTIVTLPSFQVYVSWAVMFVAPYAGILAGLAWLRLTAAFELTKWRRVEAAALFFLALLTYQPAAMLFWLFAAIDILLPSAQRLAAAARKFVEGLAVAVAAMVGAYVVARAGTHFYGGARASVGHDLVGKLRWFWHQPLLNALNLFALIPTWTLAAAFAVVMAAGILLLHAGKGREAFGFLALALVLVPLSYLPNLAVAENFASYRTLGALSALLALYVWIGFIGIGQAAPRAALGLAVAAVLSFLALAVVIVPLANLPNPPSTRSSSLSALGHTQRLVPLIALFVVFAASVLLPRARFRTVVIALAAGVFAVTGVLLAARNVTTLFAKPESLEVHMLRTALRRSGTPDVRTVWFIKPNWTEGAAPFVRYDEFGLPSSYAPWVPDPAVLLLLRERGQKQRPSISVFAWDQTAAFEHSHPPSFLVVDMRKLHARHVSWSVWTLHAND